MKSAPKAMFFDYGGTLDADGISWKERFQGIYESHGIRPSQSEFDRAFYHADDTLTEEGPENLSLRDILFEQVGRVLQGLGIQDASLREGISLAFHKASLEKIEANKRVLEILKKRYQLGIISNFYGNLKAVCDETGLTPLLDIMVDSRRIGFMKPVPEIFHHALAALGRTPSEAIMVGDSLPRDMGGAKAIGMPHVLLVNRKRKAGVRPCCEDDRVIETLSDLLEYLQ